MIRLLFGLVVVSGAASTLETGSASILQCVIASTIGLAIMYWPIGDGTIKRLSGGYRNE